MSCRKSLLVGLAVVALSATPFVGSAQSSSLNTFSPYSMYGLGDFVTPGPSYIRSMGGAGTAYRHPGKINYMNPAANTAISRKTFLLNMGLEGSNYYLSDGNSKTSFNTVNIRDVAVLLPLGGRVGFGVSITPLSSIGYRISERTMTEDLEHLVSSFEGEGTISQVKAGVGVEVFKNFSLGAEMVYYHGDLSRTHTSEITSIISSAPYYPAYSMHVMEVSRVMPNFGMQWNAIANSSRAVTIGATYQPSMKLDPKYREFSYISMQNTYRDVTDTTYTMAYKLPTMISVGAYYYTPKMSVGMDYTFHQWKKTGNNAASAVDNMKYVNSNILKLGGEYTPNRYDIRRPMKRATYRMGARYGTQHMQFQGESMTDMAITAGVGIPVKNMRLGESNINLGLEFGQRGTTNKSLVKENYFKFSIGLSLFGEYWFMKQVYD